MKKKLSVIYFFVILLLFCNEWLYSQSNEFSIKIIPTTSYGKVLQKSLLPDSINNDKSNFKGIGFLVGLNRINKNNIETSCSAGLSYNSLILQINTKQPTIESKLYFNTKYAYLHANFGKAQRFYYQKFCFSVGVLAQYSEPIVFKSKYELNYFFNDSTNNYIHTNHASSPRISTLELSEFQSVYYALNEKLSFGGELVIGLGFMYFHGKWKYRDEVIYPNIPSQNSLDYFVQQSNALNIYLPYYVNFGIRYKIN